MNAKRPLVVLLTVTMVASMVAVAPAAAQQQCDVGQENSQANIGNVNIDANVNAGNVALSTPVLSPGADSDARANQIIEDNNDAFQSQSNVVQC